MEFDFFDLMGCLTLGMMDSEKVREQYHASQISPKRYIYRPQSFGEYIGQSNAKELTKINLEKIRTTKFVHFIISGTKGTGKSTLAYIIANELGLKIETYVAGNFSMENLTAFVNANQKSKAPMILFVDEIHGLEKSLGEFMYPLLEDFLWAIESVKVKPFIFIGATTDKNVLQKRLAPMIDRCQSINLEHYTSDDIKLILKQYNDKIYQLNVSEDVYDVLSKNTRYTPRIALSIFDDYVIVKDVKRVLQAHQIVRESLTTSDILILKHLIEIDKPVGAEVLSIIVQQTRQDYQTLIEPFLIQDGYISRTARGRLATEKAKTLVQEMK